MNARIVSLPALLLAGALAASHAPAGPGSVAAAAADAIGADCVDCHAAIVASYRETGMARALEPLREGEAELLAELPAVPAPPTGDAYRFEGEAGRAVLVREGRSATVRAPVAFAIGAGLLDRSYAVERGDMIWFAPLEVLPEHGVLAHAALAPHLMQDPHAAFGQAITLECLACHTDSLPPVGYPLNAWGAEHESAGVRGIGCAACHGDVGGHVEWRSADLAGEEPGGEDPILDPRDLPRPERMSVCARCHLQGDARIHLRRDARGLAPLGEDMLEHVAVFTAAEHDQDVGFVSHVERLVLSECYLGSSMTCGTCHDPHRSVFDANERGRVRAACERCHAGADRGGMGHADGLEPAPACGRDAGHASAERDCVDCHMRRTQPFDIADVEIHDHWIRVEPGEPSSFERIRAKQSTGPDIARFAWPDGGALPHAGDPGVRMLALTAAAQPDAALALADDEPGRPVRRLSMYHHVRGTLLEGAGRDEDARRAYERALILDPRQAESVVNLALVESRLGRGEQGLARLDALLETWPGSEGALRNRAVVLAGLGRIDRAIADLEAADRILPSAANARALAELHGAVGDPEAARWWREELRRRGGE